MEQKQYLKSERLKKISELMCHLPTRSRSTSSHKQLSKENPYHSISVLKEIPKNVLQTEMKCFEMQEGIKNKESGRHLGKSKRKLTV